MQGDEVGAGRLPMTRADRVLAAIAVAALVALACVGTDDLHQRGETEPLRRQVEKGHAAYVQACALDDKIQAECEARWLRAIGT